MIFLQDELKQFKTKSVNTYYNRALNLVKDNNISKAIEVIEVSFKNITEDVDILNLMGLCQYLLCNFDKAQLYWNKSLLTSSQNNRAKYYMDYLNSDKFKIFKDYYNLSINYIDKSQYENSLELLLQITKTNEDLIEPYTLIGDCYYALEKYDLAKKYIGEALRRDGSNPKYLKSLKRLDKKTSIDKKDGKINYKSLFLSTTLMVAIILLSFYWKYREDIKSFNLELEKTKAEYNELKKQIENQNKDEKNSDKIDSKKEDIGEEKEDTVEKLNYGASEFEILKEAMENFGDGNYKESINKYKYLIDKSKNDDIISESTYYLALSFQREENYNQAESFYNSYIEKYRDRSYYDDSLYNYGLMLYEKGDIGKSKEILNKLKREEADSIFVNSKVKSILDS